LRTHSVSVILKSVDAFHIFSRPCVMRLLHLKNLQIISNFCTALPSQH